MMPSHALRVRGRSAGLFERRLAIGALALIFAAASGCTGANPVFGPAVADAGDAASVMMPPSEAGLPEAMAPMDVSSPGSQMDTSNVDVWAEPDVVAQPDAPQDVPAPPEDVRIVDSHNDDASIVDAPRADTPRADAGVPMVDAIKDVGPAEVKVDNRPAGCGTVVLDVAGITKADGIAIDDDGTLYFTTDDGTDGWIGRQVGTSLNARWLRLNKAHYTRGLVLDHARRRLYVADLTSWTIIVVDLAAATPTPTVFVRNASAINDLVLDAAGTVYYTSQDTKHVYRVTGGLNVAVTTTIVGVAGQDKTPAALAFAPDGALFVGMRSAGPIVRLMLEGGTEEQRYNFGFFVGWANGLAIDSSGRLYVATYQNDTQGTVVRLSADGAEGVQVASGASFSSMAFGRGLLDCQDLYIASPSGPMRRLHTDTPGPLLP